MRIIRQDAGYSAKQGFGGPVGNNAADEKPNCSPPASDEAMSASKSETLLVNVIARPSGSEDGIEERRIVAQTEARKEHASPSVSPKPPTRSAGLSSGSATRGQVVYIAVSLTPRQAHLAAAWASSACCTMQFLIRRVAQGQRDQLFDDWERHGMPDINEPRGARGKHSTSVTLTLRPPFAAALPAQHDPLGILGLARVMGPAFRARFEEAFDLANAKIQTTTAGDEN